MPLNNNVSVIIPAGGLGKRMGNGVPKQYLLLDGRPIIDHTLSVFESHPRIDSVVVVLPEDHFAENDRIKSTFKKVSAVVTGGCERIDSVANGFAAIPDSCNVVLVHDAVRPFVRHEDIDAVVRELDSCDCCTLAAPVKDTIKVVQDEKLIESTPDRKTLWLTLTPQAFNREVLRSLLEYARVNSVKGTDECMVAELMGYCVHVVRGDYFNIKITTNEDLVFANAILNKKH